MKSHAFSASVVLVPNTAHHSPDKDARAASSSQKLDAPRGISGLEKYPLCVPSVVNKDTQAFMELGKTNGKTQLVAGFATIDVKSWLTNIYSILFYQNYGKMSIMTKAAALPFFISYEMCRSA